MLHNRPWLTLVSGKQFLTILIDAILLQILLARQPFCLSEKKTFDPEYKQDRLLLCSNLIAVDIRCNSRTAMALPVIECFLFFPSILFCLSLLFFFLLSFLYVFFFSFYWNKSYPPPQSLALHECLLLFFLLLLVLTVTNFIGSPPKSNKLKSSKMPKMLGK